MTIFLEVLDILATSFILYTALVLLRKTRSIVILRGFIALIIFYIIAVFLNLKLTVTLFQTFISFFVIILVIVFQKEIRRFFENFSLTSIYKSFEAPPTISEDIVNVLGNVAGVLAKKKKGALIVLVGNQSVERIAEGGFELNGKISEPLLISLFDPKTPGHDGAMIIEGDYISRFGTHLPLADDFNKKYPNLGTRHRAGLGLAERVDSLVIIISEERGTITIGKNSELKILGSVDKLKDEMRKFIGGGEDKKENKIISYLKYNWQDKLIVLATSSILWYSIVYTTIK